MITRITAIASSAALASCASMWAPTPLPDAAIQKARSVSEIHHIPQTEMAWACGWIYEYNRRDAACVSIAAGLATIYIDQDARQWLQDMEELHMLGHVYHKVFQGGSVRQAMLHSYINALDTLRAQAPGRVQQPVAAHP